MLRLCMALGTMVIAAGSASAHFNMLLPQAALAIRGDKVEFVYQFGHPFEHELFDAPRPASLQVTTPAGKTVDLARTLTKISRTGADGKDVTAWKFTFTPQQRGDHWFVLQTPPIWIEESKEFFHDTVQVVLHVQTQNGWEKAPIQDRGIWQTPLTRPYGLLPGMTFRSRVLANPFRLANLQAEIERYNPQKPKAIPPDELVTFKALTDPNGIFTCTLTEPGWWCMTAQRTTGKMAREGKEYPVRQRSTLWVFVETPPRAK